MRDVFTRSDLARLRALRARFLAHEVVASSYWDDEDDLALYDEVFGARIGWKWDAAIDEIRCRGHTPGDPTAGTVALYDFGCGTGVATRRMLAAFPDVFSEVFIHDLSPLAQAWAHMRILEEYPGVHVRLWDGVTRPGGAALLLVSHVLNELSPQNGVRLQNLARAFSHSLWVESGNHHDSTQLVAMREALRGEFHPIAPCPHRGACKLLEEQNSRHWCHFFSHVPSEVFQDRNWNILADALSVDLRAMPFSYLYLRRTSLGAVEEQASATRMLGAPREYKGYLKALTCRADGLGELTLQKRDDVSLFRRMQKRKSGTYFQWEIDREASRFVRSLDEPDESMVL